MRASLRCPICGRAHAHAHAHAHDERLDPAERWPLALAIVNAAALGAASWALLGLGVAMAVW